MIQSMMNKHLFYFPSMMNKHLFYFPLNKCVGCIQCQQVDSASQWEEEKAELAGLLSTQVY